MKECMRKSWFFFCAISAMVSPGVFAAHSVTPADVTVGNGLEVIANITLDEFAPPGGLQITLTSNEPGRLLFSRTPEAAGAPRLTLTVREGFRGSPDFYIQGFANSGKVTYTVTAPGLEPVAMGERVHPR